MSSADTQVTFVPRERYLIQPQRDPQICHQRIIAKLITLGFQLFVANASRGTNAILESLAEVGEVLVVELDIGTRDVTVQTLTRWVEIRNGRGGVECEIL
jgi:hypothetical protein